MDLEMKIVLSLLAFAIGVVLGFVVKNYFNKIKYLEDEIRYLEDKIELKNLEIRYMRDSMVRMYRQLWYRK